MSHCLHLEFMKCLGDLGHCFLNADTNDIHVFIQIYGTKECIPHAQNLHEKR